jgi:hypothetical protein
VVMGVPLPVPPLIDATAAERVFHVLRGGLLDLRFVTLYRGRGSFAIPPYFIQLRGGSALVEAGGDGG